MREFKPKGMVLYWNAGLREASYRWCFLHRLRHL